MNLRATIKDLPEAIRRRPRRTILVLFGLFIVNVLSFILSINFSNNSNLPAVLFPLTLFWPLALPVIGVVRLTAGKSDNEIEIKHRREITLRYFAIGTLSLLIVLIIVWRYLIETRGYFYLLESILTLALLIVLLSELLVIILWYWVRYSENKLSEYINRAPHHYLISIITLVITSMSYITYSGIKGDVDYRILNDRPVPSLFFTVIAVSQSVAWVGMFAAIGTAILGYLRPSETARTESGKENNKTDRLSVRAERQEEGKTGLVSTSLKSDKLELLTSAIELNNVRIEELLNHSTLSSHKSVSSEIIAERIGLIRGRLTQELKELTKRGNLNLTIGILTTVGAASALFWGLIVTQPLPNETEAASLLRHYLPRISFAIFIEVFSFFFLRLYKGSLEDIKYYHNELTSLDSRLLALEVATATQLSEALTPILLGLLSTDRNFILKSGESTVELEKIKAEQQYVRAVIDAISAKVPDLATIKAPNKH